MESKSRLFLWLTLIYAKNLETSRLSEVQGLVGDHLVVQYPTWRIIPGLVSS